MYIIAVRVVILWKSVPIWSLDTEFGAEFDSRTLSTLSAPKESFARIFDQYPGLMMGADCQLPQFPQCDRSPILCHISTHVPYPHQPCP